MSQILEHLIIRRGIFDTILQISTIIVRIISHQSPIMKIRRQNERFGKNPTHHSRGFRFLVSVELKTTISLRKKLNTQLTIFVTYWSGKLRFRSTLRAFPLPLMLLWSPENLQFQTLYRIKCKKKTKYTDLRLIVHNRLDSCWAKDVSD